MDKIAANQHLVVLAKEVKKAKAMVSGNLVRKIAKLKASKEKLSDEARIKKIDDKIALVLNDIKQLKMLDSYTIAKEATMRPGVDGWNRIISDSRATSDQILIARVIAKNNIQKQVDKFRKDQKDCDEWINEYIEYREKKRELNETQVANPRSQADSSRRGRARKIANTPRKKENDPKSAERKSSKDDKGRNRVELEVLEEESLHPSWKSKRKEKELMKATLAGKHKPKRIKFDDT